MVKDEEMLEELYGLLSLYFEISLGGGLVKTFDKNGKVEPPLDRIILKEAIFARITEILMRR